MSDVSITKMSSRGQIVIPQDLREELHLKEGESFAITGNEAAIVLKRITLPTKAEIMKNWKEVHNKSVKQAKLLGIREKDVPDLVHRFRGNQS